LTVTAVTHALAVTVWVEWVACITGPRVARVPSQPVPMQHTCITCVSLRQLVVDDVRRYLRKVVLTVEGVPGECGVGVGWNQWSAALITLVARRQRPVHTVITGAAGTVGMRLG
jgi:hypothetical protein